MSRMPWRAAAACPALAAVLVLAAPGGGRPSLRAQEARQDVEPYQPCVKLVSSEYIPPTRPGGPQVIRLKLDVSPDVPVGAKIELQLMYRGLPVEGQVQILELKDARREGVVFDFKPKVRLGVDTYVLICRLPLEIQPAGAQQAIEKNPKAFPPEHGSHGWTYYFMKPEYAIQVGTPEELEAEKRKTCETYWAFIEELIENMTEFTKAMKAASKGEKSSDERAFNDLVKKWRVKQGATQRKIRLFPADQPTLYQKSQQAYVNLTRLAVMVSKRAILEQKQACKGLGFAYANPRWDGKDKKEQTLGEFDGRYPYRVDAEALNERVEKIESFLATLCPPAEAEGEEKPAGEEEGEEAEQGEEGESGGEKDAGQEDAAGGEKAPGRRGEKAGG